MPNLTHWTCWNPHGQSKETENLASPSSSKWKRELSPNSQDENPTSQRVEFPHCSD